MSIRDGHHRKVSFDTNEELGDKIDKLVVVIGKLAKRDSRTDSSNHKSIRVDVEVRRGITIREIIRIGTNLITDQIAETEDNTDKTEAGLEYVQNFRRGNFRGNVRNYGRQNSTGEYRESYRNEL